MSEKEFPNQLLFASDSKLFFLLLSVRLGLFLAVLPQKPKDDVADGASISGDPVNLPRGDLGGSKKGREEARPGDLGMPWAETTFALSRFTLGVTGDVANEGGDGDVGGAVAGFFQPAPVDARRCASGLIGDDDAHVMVLCVAPSFVFSSVVVLFLLVR